VTREMCPVTDNMTDGAGHVTVTHCDHNSIANWHRSPNCYLTTFHSCIIIQKSWDYIH